MATFEAKVTSKGQITLPAKIRDRLRIEAGDKVVFTESADGTYRLAASSPGLRELKGIIRTGAKITGEDIARWIDDARSKALSNPRSRRREKTRQS
jgi:antitoxin PrlF